MILVIFLEAEYRLAWNEVKVGNERKNNVVTIIATLYYVPHDRNYSKCFISIKPFNYHKSPKR